MPIEIRMPALSPTMDEGTLAKWLVREGESVKSGDLLAEIETDKATMEFEAVDEGTISRLVVPEGTDGVKVGAVIALIADGPEEAAPAEPAPARADEPRPAAREAQPEAPPPSAAEDDHVAASPLARRLAKAKGIDLGAVSGSGPGGRIVKADLGLGERTPIGTGLRTADDVASRQAPALASAFVPDIPQEAIKLSNMRRTIARRLTESKQQVPHIYLTVDVVLDPLLELRGELNAALERRGVKLSVNDMLVKALGIALIEVPACNVQFAGDALIRYARADISVAVSIPGGLITPVVTGADAKSVATIATELKELAGRAREGKLRPEEYQGGTASLSNMGMYGIRQFEAVINPPQAMIMAIGAGERRPWVADGALGVATVMSATGSFDHRAIDGADGAKLMTAFKRLVEQPLAMLA